MASMGKTAAIATSATRARAVCRRCAAVSTASAKPIESGKAHQATHFCASRSRPAPGMCAIAQVRRLSPNGRLASDAISTPAMPSSTSDLAGPVPHLRASGRNPAMATATVTKTSSGAIGPVRLPGTTSLFQIPPSPSTLRNAGPQPSALAPNALTPAGSDSVLVWRKVGTSQGKLSSTAMPSVGGSRRGPADTIAVSAARMPPGGVSTAGAQASTRRGSAFSPLRRAIPTLAIHGRQA